jgi:hypothetical protein
MNITVFFICWIAISSCFGVLFGFTSIGLTHLTAAISLFLGLIAPLIALLIGKYRYRPFDTIPRIQISDILISIVFLVFTIRAFHHLIYVHGDKILVSSPNNIGDICLHLTHINFLAANPQFWPQNPIFAFQPLHYPFGVNLFNAELKLVGIDPNRGLFLVAILCSLLTLRALFRFNGSFGVASFLFNGGLAGFLIFGTWHLKDYQDAVAWKSIPLAMFLTQRGLLYAIPAGLLLLTHWRQKYFLQKPLLPSWVEYLLYATMPLFHVHTFLFLSVILLFCFLFGEPEWRFNLIKLIAISLIPATLFIYFVVGLNHNGAIGWAPGWMQPQHQSFWWFWINNFGLFIPLTILLLIYFLAPKSIPRDVSDRYLHLFFFPSLLIFVACGFIKFAPWAWDNTKLIFWAYMLILYCAWNLFFKHWPLILRAPVLLLLFFSGAVSLTGGLAEMNHHYEIGNEQEWAAVDKALENFPSDAVFAAYPTYNNPVLVTGHEVVLGYEGHLWSHGLPYQAYWPQLQQFLSGAPNWQSLIKPLHIDYVFWGPYERSHYPSSLRPWEKIYPLVAQGPWGSVYDLRGNSN